MVENDRRPLIAGNWKMHNTTVEAVNLAEALVHSKVADLGPEVLICPPFTSLFRVSHVVSETEIKLGAQNMHWEEQGAFTGEVAPGMLTDLGCQYVIIGHSERRQFFAETDETVSRKVEAALAKNIKPIICVGETLQQREAGITEDLIQGQVKAALARVNQADLDKVTFAYEPIWAIGTGKTADATEANRICHLIRETVASFDQAASEKVRILYGGSVKPGNFADFSAQQDIDGALVGGASLDAGKFAEIIKVAG